MLIFMLCGALFFVCSPDEIGKTKEKGPSCIGCEDNISKEVNFISLGNPTPWYLWVNRQHPQGSIEIESNNNISITNIIPDAFFGGFVGLTIFYIVSLLGETKNRKQK